MFLYVFINAVFGSDISVDIRLYGVFKYCKLKFVSKDQLYPQRVRNDDNKRVVVSLFK